LSARHSPARATPGIDLHAQRQHGAAGLHSMNSDELPDPTQVTVVHYACESFAETTDDPRPTAIVLRNTATGAVTRLVDDDNEGNLYRVLIDALGKRAHRHVVTWNMKDEGPFGWAALARRARALGIELREPQPHTDIGNWVWLTYGNDYVLHGKHGRFHELAVLNNLPTRDWHVGTKKSPAAGTPAQRVRRCEVRAAAIEGVLRLAVSGKLRVACPTRVSSVTAAPGGGNSEALADLSDATARDTETEWIPNIDPEARYRRVLRVARLVAPTYRRVPWRREETRALRMRAELLRLEQLVRVARAEQDSAVREAARTYLLHRAQTLRAACCSVLLCDTPQPPESLDALLAWAEEAAFADANPAAMMMTLARVLGGRRRAPRRTPLPDPLPWHAEPVATEPNENQGSRSRSLRRTEEESKQQHQRAGARVANPDPSSQAIQRALDLIAHEGSRSYGVAAVIDLYGLTGRITPRRFTLSSKFVQRDRSKPRSPQQLPARPTGTKPRTRQDGRFVSEASWTAAEVERALKGWLERITKKRE